MTYYLMKLASELIRFLIATYQKNNSQGDTDKDRNALIDIVQEISIWLLGNWNHKIMESQSMIQKENQAANAFLYLSYFICGFCIKDSPISRSRKRVVYCSAP